MMTIMDYCRVSEMAFCREDKQRAISIIDRLPARYGNAPLYLFRVSSWPSTAFQLLSAGRTVQEGGHVDAYVLLSSSATSTMD